MVTKIEVTDGNYIIDASFHDVTVSATRMKLEKLFGQPTCEESNPYEDVQCEWDFKLHYTDGTGQEQIADVTLYDWKEYRRYSRNETLQWHIGGKSPEEETLLSRFISGQGTNDPDAQAEVVKREAAEK